MAMKCPDCGGRQIGKNGHREQKQKYICVKCGRPFLEHYKHRG